MSTPPYAVTKVHPDAPIGWHTVVHKEQGWLVSTSRHQAYADAICKLMNEHTKPPEPVDSKFSVRTFPNLRRRVFYTDTSIEAISKAEQLNSEAVWRHYKVRFIACDNEFLRSQGL